MEEAPSGTPRVNVTIDLVETDSDEEETSQERVGDNMEETHSGEGEPSRERVGDIMSENLVWRVRPPPPPSDAAMKLERSRVFGVSAPLFVIGEPRTVRNRRQSASDEDVKILPSSRECQDQDSDDDVIEID